MIGSILAGLLTAVGLTAWHFGPMAAAVVALAGNLVFLAMIAQILTEP